MAVSGESKPSVCWLEQMFAQPEASAAEWPLRDLPSCSPGSQLVGARLLWEKCQPAMTGAREIRIPAGFGGPASLCLSSDPWRSRFPLCWLLSHPLGQQKMLQVNQCQKKAFTTLPMEKGKYLFCQVSQGFQRESANTCNKLSSSISSYW